ncbi:esterase/lipase family protein [Haliea sp. E17]|uniref:esterase/lipase family protein n=1 Tax=Haliea sp. E17 TaxID=3401576 RepID=UPI003AAE2947
MWKVILLALLALAPAAAGAATSAAPAQCVILLHGLLRSELSMLAVAWKLQDAGYAVANVTYPSLTRPIPELAQIAVNAGLAECREQGLSRFHFVTHSLGGILLREYLSHTDIEGLERVVMLGPPNQGSALADYVQGIDFIQPLAPQAIAQLGTGEASVPRQLGPVDFELGVIAGTMAGLSPLPWVLQGPSDGTVTVEETRVAGMVDFIELDASHSFIMWNADALQQVLYFLQQGHFDHQPKDAPAAAAHRAPDFSPRSGP